MFLKYFYDQALAHASYVVACQRAKAGVVVDPGRDIQQYLDLADREDFEIIAVAETHIHADYVSGARELADAVGAKLYVSNEGPDEWKYRYLDQYAHQLVLGGDQFYVGKIRFDVLHTPGHTPESISFLLTDEGGGASEPMGIFTGDFVFVGAIGRPDLLEEAAGLANTAEPGARDLFRSAERFKQLPDYLQVWPAHGAGSACGKGLGAIPSSTVGYEKRFNPALQFDDEEAFVQYILAEQPEAPTYFAKMKRVNKEGPELLSDSELELIPVSELDERKRHATVIDLQAPQVFAEGHVPGSLNIPASMLAAWAGWLVDYDRPVYLIAEPRQVAEAMRVLHKIGLDTVAGVFSTRAVRAAGMMTQTYPQKAPIEIALQMAANDVTLIDVRADAEWSQSRIAGAKHKFLGRLHEGLSELRDTVVVTQCQSGTRSAIAASVLQASGIEVINMLGGFQAWNDAGLDIESSSCNAGCQLA